MYFVCDICERHFSRNYDRMRHKLIKHPEESKEEYDDDSVQDDTIVEEADEEENLQSDNDHLSVSAHSNESSDTESGDDGDDGDADATSAEVWDDIISSVLDNVKDKIIEEAGDDTDKAAMQKAYETILPDIRKSIRDEYLRLNTRFLDLKPDPKHREVMKTKRYLQDIFEIPSGEALSNVVRMRKELFDQLLPSEIPHAE